MRAGAHWDHQGRALARRGWCTEDAARGVEGRAAGDDDRRPDGCGFGAPRWQRRRPTARRGFPGDARDLWRGWNYSGITGFGRASVRRRRRAWMGEWNGPGRCEATVAG